MVKKFGTNLGQGLESHQINRLIRKSQFSSIHSPLMIRIFPSVQL